MDLNDELLALRMQLVDLDIVSVSSDPQGEERNHGPPDSELALQDFRLQLEDAIQQLNDIHFARSFAIATDIDINMLRELMHEDTQSVADHQLAGQLDDKIGAPNVSTSDDITSSDGHSDGSAVSCRSDLSADEENDTCVCCGDEKPRLELVQTPCADHYCLGCLKELFVRSTKDESLFPPRCCREPIPLDRIVDHLSFDDIHRFEIATIEFNTPNRTYCANAACSVFILPENVRADAAECQACQTVTCSICKQSGHDGDCPEDTSVQTTLALASTNNWRRCGNYNRMVELGLGCNHITYVQSIDLSIISSDGVLMAGQMHMSRRVVLLLWCCLETVSL
jgi:hypothetical protein